MSVFTRFTDIINSNLNALLDEAEDPEKMVMLITREMEETLVEVRSSTARYIAEKKEIRARIKHFQLEVSSWENKAEIAVNKGRDDLAKAALKERGGATLAMDALQRDALHIDTQIERLQSDTRQLQAKLKEARIRQQAILLRRNTMNSRLKIKRQLHDDHIDDALSRFDLYESRLDDLEGQVESYDLGKLSLSEEIAALHETALLDNELAALKARMSAQLN